MMCATCLGSVLGGSWKNHDGNGNGNGNGNVAKQKV